jgi:photosystem II stability/assembly factor-like uncharacterized protein
LLHTAAKYQLQLAITDIIGVREPTTMTRHRLRCAFFASSRLRVRPLLAAVTLLSARAFAPLPAQQAPNVNPSLFAEMRWRSIGPHRAGRTKAAAGHPSQPFTFYIGVHNGGVWKTTDAGRVWKPIFDEQSTGSIGWVAVAPSDPNVLYVGSGEGLPRPDLSVGNGVYKSTDAGKSWTHLGLRNGQQIPKLAIDPRDPNRLFVAVLGHPYGPNEERGLFRSTDGGQSFDKVLYIDENTGAKDVDIDPLNPNIVYATFWEHRQGPWENAAWTGTNGGIYKSVDGGANWRKLTQGVPDGLTSAELVIAPSNPRRLYVTMGVSAAGGRGGGAAPGLASWLIRSDDAGESWTRVTSDTRPGSRIDEAAPHVHPKDPNTLIVTSIVAFISRDGGQTFVPFKGAPGGDDYQGLWMNPNNPEIILMTADQGAVVTLNGGQSWSSWYNQPTAQFYHVMTDNAFPYRVCGGQQESGSACISSRGNDGQITFREWHPVAVEEYGYVAPDPLEPDIVYGGKVSRYDRRTGQFMNVGPLVGRSAADVARLGRTVRTLPVVFSTVDPRALFYGTNVLWKTVDGGRNWKQISPDLTRKSWALPRSVGKYSNSAPSAQGTGIGAQVIYTIGPSYRDSNRIWIGTDDGVIATTADGGLTWENVTPPQIGPFWKVFMIDPGRFDPLTAYAAVNTLRIDEMNPHLYRTRDGGKTWTEITNGIPGGAPVSTIREDPKRKGLLFAGSETQVYVSFDDGDHWQSLRLNMAPSSVRDLVIKDDDLVVGTHGRGFWILDDITPLRQINPKSHEADAILFKPTTAWRVRWNLNTDTPLPPDEPTAPNPPDGGIINYYLKAPARQVTLEILRLDGRLVRRYSSSDPATPIPDESTAPLPRVWYRPPQTLLTAQGMHRFLWDVRMQPLPGAGGGRGGLPIAAVAYNTVPAAGTPWANPGTYTLKLTVDGRSYTQPIMVRQDPRVKTPALVMQQIYSLTSSLYYGAVDAQAAAAKAQALRDQIAQRLPQTSGALKTALVDLDRKVADLRGTTPAAPGGGRAGGAGGGANLNTLSAVGASLSGLVNSLQAADVAPTANTLTAIANARRTAAAVMARWATMQNVELAALDTRLKAAGLVSLRQP